MTTSPHDPYWLEGEEEWEFLLFRSELEPEPQPARPPPLRRTPTKTDETGEAHRSPWGHWTTPPE